MGSPSLSRIEHAASADDGRPLRTAASVAPIR